MFFVELWLQQKKLVYLELSKDIQNNHDMVVERHDVVVQSGCKSPLYSILCLQIVLSESQRLCSVPVPVWCLGVGLGQAKPHRQR